MTKYIYNMSSQKQKELIDEYDKLLLQLKIRHNEIELRNKFFILRFLELFKNLNKISKITKTNYIAYYPFIIKFRKEFTCSSLKDPIIINFEYQRGKIIDNILNIYIPSLYEFILYTDTKEPINRTVLINIILYILNNVTLIKSHNFRISFILKYNESMYDDVFKPITRVHIFPSPDLSGQRLSIERV